MRKGGSFQARNIPLAWVLIEMEVGGDLSFQVLASIEE